MTSLSLPDLILSRSSKGVGLVAISDVYLDPDRLRKPSPSVTAYIEEDLMPSITEHGIIQPPVIHICEPPMQVDGRSYPYILIAGGCRTEACIKLGLTHIPYNTRENLTTDELIELEQEENVTRLNMTWQDRVLGIAKVHQLRSTKAKAEGHAWGQKQTGKLLKCSHGHINSALAIAACLKSGDTEVIAAPNFSKAQEILLGRKEDALIASMAASSAPTSTAPRATPAMGPMREPSGISVTTAAIPTKSKIDILPAFKQDLDIDLSQMLFHMDNKDWFDQRADESVDLIYTDIPYGIDMDNLDFNSTDLDRVADEHDVDENVAQMEPFLKNAFRVLKDQKYLVFWYDLAHHEKLLNWGKAAGFTVQPYPLIWCKEHPCRNRAGNVWWTKSVEYVMVMRKGSATLRSAQTKCYFLADGSAERNTQRNPFSKPFAVSKQIITPLAIPGDTMVDPYAGEGSLIRCGITMGLKVIGVEKSGLHFPRLTEHVKQTYGSMTRSGVTFS